MNIQWFKRALAASSLLCGLVTWPVHAQSSDALIDKLVEKGILTVKEANTLRDEADNDFKKAAAARSATPDWVKTMKLYGDFRGRFDQINLANAMVVDQDRFRYRVRAGMTIDMLDSVEAGFRLTSGEATGSYGGDPISQNATLTGNGSKKFVWIDQAYGKVTMLDRSGLNISGTIGKMDNPFVTSDMVFDPDYTPEGGAIQVKYEPSSSHTVKGNFGAFSLVENKYSPQDPWMLGVQGRWDGKYIERQGGGHALESGLGLSWYGISSANNLDTNSFNNSLSSGSPDRNFGNSRSNLITPDGRILPVLAYKYAPIVADASLTYNLRSMPLYPGRFPIKVGGEFMVNPAAGPYMGNKRNPVQDKGWWVGVTLGKLGKKGTWEVSYRYEYLEGDAWWEELTDSDFGAYNMWGLTYDAAIPAPIGKAGYMAGTNVKGHIVKASYALYDSVTLSFKYWLTDQILPFSGSPSSSATRLQVDLLWKF